MLKIGIIKEGKIPADNRVALTPAQCKWVQENFSQCEIFVQRSESRCFSDREYRLAGITLTDSLENCDVLFGIKEVPPQQVLPQKKYLFFSHTCKKQPHNQKLLQTFLSKGCTLVDYECLRHEDGQRIIGFGFFAGIVGAHNGMMAYGNRTGTFQLKHVYQQRDFKTLIHTYFGLKLPNVKIAVTGSGRVAHGILEIMNLMGVIEVEKEDYLSREFAYPVYVQLKGADLYAHKESKPYNRDHFHEHPKDYVSRFENYLPHTGVLLNGVFWDKDVPRLFEKEAIRRKDFRIQTIADITDDENGSVPINVGDQTIENPVYGIDKASFEKTAPYLPNSVDVMAVGNLPNELPRDASKYFGEQLIKYVLPDLFSGESEMIKRATIAKEGRLTEAYGYLCDYAAGKVEN
ncbi:NAD(P)-dependent oxidoreductase [Flavisolibacter ginsenosidimutans]|uniref:Alanine dehydrogenase n=1 Tax=Flavisolibacter ginsenosidimutans TaxID=661481 RepID=A0A5B8UJ90_9BACT|nr:NAD(P)-dependent oxidoreductase [Flavisolibacter ginsenosidimutans]QEC56160.1 alanine dehydrogenase [Flavisolibacter ginsenosidimutans]